ncbi:aldose 1-epimerase [Trueperella sp. LYQ143]|uniref:aldose 1-epimerase n=1 Tax=unclassified Trueperella TaxID=2630174 RepID=UPI003982FCDA
MVKTEITATSALGLPAWQLTSPTGAQALISERGAALLSWQPTPEAELIRGYATAEELFAGVGARGIVMAPWAGAMTWASYRFDGQSYSVPVEACTNGLAYAHDFHATATDSTLSLTTSIEPTDAYPWSCEISAHYSLDSGSDGEEHLSLTVWARNTSDRPAPITLGWHPYINLPARASISNLAVRVPARTKILTDHFGVPLPGESAQSGVSNPVEIDYIGARRLDDFYRDLVPDSYGVVTTRVSDPASSASIELTQEPGEAPVVHVYSGDNLEREPRSALALAPMSHVPDAFNRPDSAGDVCVAPGQLRQMTATLTYRVNS